jgi:CheY-like chemotaxis protein
MILVAEDDLTLRYLAKRQLKSLGFECDVAEDGREAVEKASEKTYRLIFMDVQMPNMDGIDATATIREKEKQSGKQSYTPIIAMTANPDKPRCLKAGMNDFIFKPVFLSDLEKMVNRWLSEPTVL